MDEQPVAFATSRRSPNSWVSSRRYGVSPQPAHAPEYSKSGVRYCTPAHERRVEPRGLVVGQRVEERQVPSLALEERRLGLHVDGADAGGFEAARRAGLDAQLAAGAVLDGHLQREPQVGEAAAGERRGREALGRVRPAHGSS